MVLILKHVSYRLWIPQKKKNFSLQYGSHWLESGLYNKAGNSVPKLKLQLN